MKSYKTEILSFDDWAKFQGLPLEKDESGLYVNRHTHYARKGWEAKPEKAEIGELKKRVGLALNKIDFWVSSANGDAAYVANSIESILKGE